jgi:hypothetical protein
MNCKDLEGNDHDVILCTVQEFGWRDLGKTM